MLVYAKAGRRYVLLDAAGVVLEIFTAETRASWDDATARVLQLVDAVPSVGQRWDGRRFLDPRPLSPPLDESNLDNLPKVLKALGLLIAQYAGKTPAQVKADFLTIYKSL